MTRGKRLGRPARSKRTARGIAGTRLIVYIEPIVQNHVPLEHINRCIKEHQRSPRDSLVSKKLDEPVFRTKCRHQGFEWWAVSFPRQRRLFLGPPEFFARFL